MGQPFIVSLQQIIIVSSYFQILSRESRKFSPWNFLPRKWIEPGIFEIVVRWTNHYNMTLYIITYAGFSLRIFEGEFRDLSFLTMMSPTARRKYLNAI